MSSNLISESSNTLSSSNLISDIQNFKNNFYGLSYSFKTIPNILRNNTNDVLFDVGYFIGKRSNMSTNIQQNKFSLFFNYQINLNAKHSIDIRSQNELLDAPDHLSNELYRIGGINSIRGFNEQSILTSKYSVLNLEYRYNTSQNSKFYTITDFAILNSSFEDSTSKLYSLGLGYFFNTEHTNVNISYALGKMNSASFNLNNSKVYIKITYPF